MKKLFKKCGWSVIAIIIGGLIIAIALVIFNISTVNSLEQFIHRNMEETNKTAISSINYSFKSFVDMLEQQVKTMNFMQDPTDKQIMTTLKTFATDKRFERISLITYEGKGYSSEYGVIDVPDMQAISNMDKEYTTIANPRITDQGELVLDIGTPAYIDRKKVGRLIATIGNEALMEMYVSNSLQGDAGLTLITQNGIVITNIAEREMAIDIKDDFYKYHENSDINFVQNTLSNVKNDIKNNRSGWMKYWKNGNSYCVNYQPFGINNWYMLISATNKTLEMQAGDICRLALILTVIILLTVCAVAVVIVWQRSKEQERLATLKNTYSVAIRKTNDLFYEVDIDSDKIVDRSESVEKAIWKETPKNYSNALTQIANVCAPECRQQFLDTFLPQNIKIKVKEGISSINFEYKITPDENTVRWLSATLVPIVDNTNNCTKLICMENDITEQMLHQERLRLSATLDGLTGLYNKISTKNYIDLFLTGEGKDGKHAFLIIDIDHFKSINDTLGHAKGDAVISEYSSVLRKIFRKNDIVGRIGGDEFVILLKDYGIIELVFAKAQEICDGFRKIHTLVDAPDKEVSTSASVGISLYSTDGSKFDELYKNADLALYKVKENGRDGYRHFDNKN